MYSAALGLPHCGLWPGDSSLDHTPDEHIAVDEYLAAIHVLTRTIERLAIIPLE
jgi:LysW-gamma-L-lysine carboxypeptidase